MIEELVSIITVLCFQVRIIIRIKQGIQSSSRLQIKYLGMSILRKHRHDHRGKKNHGRRKLNDPKRFFLH